MYVLFLYKSYGYTERGSRKCDISVSPLSHGTSRTKIHCQPPPLVRVAYYASPCITRLVLCQTKARHAKDRSLQAGIGVHPPAQGTRATLALRAYIMRKRPICELSCFDRDMRADLLDRAHFRMHFSFYFHACSRHIFISISTRNFAREQIASPMHY